MFSLLVRPSSHYLIWPLGEMNCPPLVLWVVDIVQDSQQPTQGPSLRHAVRQSSLVPTTAPAFLTSLSSRPASLFFMLPPQHTTA